MPSTDMQIGIAGITLNRRTGMRKAKPDDADPARKMLRAVRKAELGADNSGSGFTIIKLRQAPLAQLVEKKKIGPEEMQAAQQIEQAFFAIDSRGRLQGMNLDRVDKSRITDLPWPARIVRAVYDYQTWANYWSGRNKAYGDPMLEVVISAVIDERPIREIALDIGRRHSTVEQGLAYGLRHYAAWAKIVFGQQSQNWIDAGRMAFVQGNTRLIDAQRRAAVER